MITARKRKNVEILRRTLSGVTYVAALRIDYDSRGHVMKYSVTTYRDPITAKEKEWVRRIPSLTVRLRLIQVHRYVNNVVLARDTELNGPHGHGSTPDMELEGF
ncbi:MAG: hypothetical protein ACI9BH_001942 [Paracoccaceae bacterium]